MQASCFIFRGFIWPDFTFSIEVWWFTDFKIGFCLRLKANVDTSVCDTRYYFSLVPFRDRQCIFLNKNIYRHYNFFLSLLIFHLLILKRVNQEAICIYFKSVDLRRSFWQQQFSLSYENYSPNVSSLCQFSSSFSLWILNTIWEEHIRVWSFLIIEKNESSEAHHLKWLRRVSYT